MRKIALILAGMLVAGAANAEVMLYKGDSVANAGITLGDWGSGKATEAGEKFYEGSRSIKVFTQDLHAGGRIDFKSPVEIIEQNSGVNSYIQFRLWFGARVKQGTSSPTSFMSLGVYKIPGVSPQHNADSGYYSEDDIPLIPKVNTVRVVLESAEGKAIDATVDAPTLQEDGWFKVAFPFKSLGLLKEKSFKVSRILFFTDIPDTIYIGEIAAIEDETPITIQPMDDQYVAANDVVTLRAEADGGASALKYTWNFKDRGLAGIDGEGQLVTHQFKSTGDYDVQLTVSDIWGIKKPVTATVKISVN